MRAPVQFSWWIYGIACSPSTRLGSTEVFDVISLRSTGAMTGSTLYATTIGVPNNASSSVTVHEAASAA